MSPMININTNFVIPLHHLQRNQKAVDSSFEKLSSGKNINKASDDPVGLIKAVNLEAVSRGLETMNDYNSYKNSENGITQGQLGQDLEGLQNARALTVRAADSTVSSDERTILSNQMNDLGVHGIDISSQEAANSSLSTLDTSIRDLASHISQLGSESNIMDIEEQSNQAQQEKIESARSMIEDVDVAKVVSQQVQNQLRLGFSVAVLQRSQQVGANQALQLLS